MEISTEKESTTINDDNLTLGYVGPFEDDKVSDCPSMLLFLSLLGCIPFDYKEDKTESED